MRLIYERQDNMAAIKTIGSSGQITIGKQYSGQTVLVDEIEPGVWMVKVGAFIPDNERWLHEPENKAKLDAAIAWAEANPSCSDNLAEIEAAVHGR
jgi:hypothetical protein